MLHADTHKRKDAGRQQGLKLSHPTTAKGNHFDRMPSCHLGRLSPSLYREDPDMLNHTEPCFVNLCFHGLRHERSRKELGNLT